MHCTAPHHTGRWSLCDRWVTFSAIHIHASIFVNLICGECQGIPWHYGNTSDFPVRSHSRCKQRFRALELWPTSFATLNLLLQLARARISSLACAGHLSFARVAPFPGLRTFSLASKTRVTHSATRLAPAACGGILNFLALEYTRDFSFHDNAEQKDIQIQMHEMPTSSRKTHWQALSVGRHARR